jgi:hypothetical protein
MEFWLLVALFTKHFIVDFPLQTPYQYKNKGLYGHLGGLIHSGLHGISTFLIALYFVGPTELALYVAVLDYVLHYHIDYLKVYVNNKYKLGPTTHESFWYLLGFDQFLHSLTYIYIAYQCTT